jgi:hypothetical protein
MYGFSPAAFIMRRHDDWRVYETVESVWLGAWFERYVEKAAEGEIFEVTKLGISTGQLLMSEEEVDRYRPIVWRSHRSTVFKFVAQAPQFDILEEMMKNLTDEIAEGIAIPTRFLFKDCQSRASLEELRQHERMLEKFPEKGLRASRLRMLGVKI